MTPASACGVETTVTVSGQANVFGAGIGELPAPAGGGGGVAPICLDIPPGAATLSVSEASGSVSFTTLRAPEVHLHKCPGGREAVLDHGPDGTIGGCPGELPGGTIESAGVVSGIRSRDRVGYLVGVFLPDGISDLTVPEALDFEGDYDFAQLSPRLAQLFFIGDGRAGQHHRQRFAIPSGATRMYLGIADAIGFQGPPGSYDDNSGSFQVEVRIR